MTRIYQQASKVFIWLGLAGASTDAPTICVNDEEVFDDVGETALGLLEVLGSTDCFVIDQGEMIGENNQWCEILHDRNAGLESC